VLDYSNHTALILITSAHTTHALQTHTNRAAKRMKLVRAPQPPPLPPVPAPERARYGARGSPSRTEPAVDSSTAWSNGCATVNGSVVVYGRIVEVHRGPAAAASKSASNATATGVGNSSNNGNTSNSNTSSGVTTHVRYDLKWEDGLLQYNVSLPYVKDALIVQDCSSLGSGAVLDDKVLQLY
jgi:hypothetical protein